MRDTSGPTFVDVWWEPESPAEEEPVTVYASIVDISGVASVILSYGVATTWTNVSMSYNDSLGLWMGVIPGMPALVEVRFKIYACDSEGNWAVSDEYSYTVRDTSGPMFVDVWWEPESPAEEVDVLVYANITDVSGVSSATLSYYVGAWTNVSMSYNDSLGLWMGVIPGMPALVEVRFKIYACDSEGNWAVSDEYSYTVRDTSGPMFVDVWWEPSEPREGEQVVVYANISDMSGVSNVILSYYNGTVWINVSMEYDENRGLWTGTIPGMPAGEVRFKIYAVDICGNWSVSQEYTYTVAKKGRKVWLILLPLVAIVVICVVALLFFKRKKVERREE